MLFLLFSLDRDRYALDVRDILAVRPVPLLKGLPGTPAWIAGLSDDAGGVFPVIDMAALALARMSRRVMSTRLALLAYPHPDGRLRRLGVIIERATSMLRADEAAFGALPIGTPEARYLGPVLRTGDGLVQRVRVADLLPSAVSDRLFGEAT